MECDIKGETCGFECTGYKGDLKWKELEKIVDSIECGTCADHGIELIRFFHDHVSLGLGKKPFNKILYLKILSEINCVADTAKAQGRL